MSEGPFFTKIPIMRRVHMAFILNHLIDAGHRPSIESILATVARGAIFERMEGEFDSVRAWEVIPADVRPLFLEEWRSMASEQSDRKTFLCENNGYSLLLAYTLEGAQRHLSKLGALDVV